MPFPTPYKSLKNMDPDFAHRFLISNYCLSLSQDIPHLLHFSFYYKGLYFQ